MDTAIVDMQHVSFSYDGTMVLQDIDLTIYEKDFLTIIGPNGGGKTTILKLILGLLRPTTGTITVFGGKPQHARSSIGYLPQLLVSEFDFPISVLEVVLMGRLGKTGPGRRYSKKDVAIALDALDNVGMREFQRTAIGHLSGGQRQRVFIARALATQPRLLLLDEPVSSVDTKWQQSFYDLLVELNKRIAIVLVTHDIGVISTYIDKIACLNVQLFYHGSKKEGMHKIAEMYECPVQLISHETGMAYSSKGND
jgi:zinc transport system ATP-binding protein